MLPPPKHERQQSVNNFWSCILDNQSAKQLHQHIIIVPVAILGRSGADHIATIS